MLTCLYCNAANPDEYNFCGECGAQINSQFVPPTSPPDPLTDAIDRVGAFIAGAFSNAFQPRPSAPTQPISQTILSVIPPDQQSLALQAEIASYVRRGFHVVSQTATTAQLLKPKRLSCLILLITFAFWFVGFGILLTLGYLLVHLASNDEIAYLTVDEYGRIFRTNG